MEWAFFLLGIIAALIANMTGTGGGIIFFPVFVMMGISPAAAAATSVVIQSVGMSSGSLSWSIFFKRYRIQFQLLWRLALFCALFSILGVYVYIQFLKVYALDVHLVFRILSIFIATVLLINYFRYRGDYFTFVVSKNEYINLAIISFFGGMITAVVSVGVGELLAAYLILRRYQPDFAIAIAVIVSALSVISLVPHYTWQENTANLQIALAVIPGTIIGGFAARYVAKMISLRMLKLVFIVWVLVLAFL